MAEKLQFSLGYLLPISRLAIQQAIKRKKHNTSCVHVTVLKGGKQVNTTVHLGFNKTLTKRKEQYKNSWNKQYKEEWSKDESKLKTLDQVKTELEKLGVSYFDYYIIDMLLLTNFRINSRIDQSKEK
jgi:hypothetical protein